MSPLTKIICLIACHGAPADHFATFAEHLINDGYAVQVYASGPAIKKFQERNIPIAMSFEADNLADEDNLANTIVARCSRAFAVLTDVGHPFDKTLQRAFLKDAPWIKRLAYYDNPEPYVPGGYSQTAAKVMKLANSVLFANANLASAALYKKPYKEIDLPFKERVGIGYYPVCQAEKIAEKRETSQAVMREKFFAKHELHDNGQKILVYFGGNNETYFNKAFPAFLNILTEGIKIADLSNYVVVMQQHPGAKTSNKDISQLDSWVQKYGQEATSPKVIISNETSDTMQVIAGGALYYQTSMGPLFALAGIPIIQVGHEIYEDILVKNNLCIAVTNPSDFVRGIAHLNLVATSEQRIKIFLSCGISKDWYIIFKEILI